MEAPFTWILTRDGSPTLWHNGIGESFRSVRGAFTESWTVFVSPALEKARSKSFSSKCVIGEFGLGAGTNWLLWSLAATAAEISFEYFAIESNPAAFEMGVERWRNNLPLVAAFLSKWGVPVTGLQAVFERLEKPRIYPALEDAARQGQRANFWFHDPFGFEVNPDGYSPETLRMAAKVWKEGTWGASYACNRHFREELVKLNADVKLISTDGENLKRQRLEFQCRDLSF